jgi:hypothetical protein
MLYFILRPDGEYRNTDAIDNAVGGKSSKTRGNCFRENEERLGVGGKKKSDMGTGYGGELGIVGELRWEGERISTRDWCCIDKQQRSTRQELRAMRNDT